MGDGKNLIKYVGVARLDSGADHCIMASYCQDDFESEVGYDFSRPSIIRKYNNLKILVREVSKQDT